MTALIDLEALSEKYLEAELHVARDIHNLIAAVNVLQKRVAELELALSLKNVRHGKALQDRVLAAEANMAEMVRVLERIVKGNHRCPTLTWAQDEARMILAATPAKVTERAKAVRNCINALRYYTRNEISQIVQDALDNYDALDEGDKQ